MKESRFFLSAVVVVVILGGGAFFFWWRREPVEAPTVKAPPTEAPSAVVGTSYGAFTTVDGNLSGPRCG